MMYTDNAACYYSSHVFQKEKIHTKYIYCICIRLSIKQVLMEQEMSVCDVCIRVSECVCVSEWYTVTAMQRAQMTDESRQHQHSQGCRRDPAAD